MTGASSVPGLLASATPPPTAPRTTRPPAPSRRLRREGRAREGGDEGMASLWALAGRGRDASPRLHPAIARTWSSSTSSWPETACHRRRPSWAAGLSRGIRCEAGRWFTDLPMGVVEVRFTGAVDQGILDRDVTLPGGLVVHDPLRVVPNDRGSEIVFTVFRRDDVSDADFRADVEAGCADLDRLADPPDRGSVD